MRAPLRGAPAPFAYFLLSRLQVENSQIPNTLAYTLTSRLRAMHHLLQWAVAAENSLLVWCFFFFWGLKFVRVGMPRFDRCDFRLFGGPAAEIQPPFLCGKQSLGRLRKERGELCLCLIGVAGGIRSTAAPVISFADAFRQSPSAEVWILFSIPMVLCLRSIQTS